MVEKIVTSFEMKFRIRFVETKVRCSQFAERKVGISTTNAWSPYYPDVPWISYSLTVDLPPREDVSSQKQPQFDLPPSREDISSQQLQLDLPLRETFFPRKNNRNSTSPCRNNRNSTSPFARRYFLATVATRPTPFAYNRFANHRF